MSKTKPWSKPEDEPEEDDFEDDDAEIEWDDEEDDVPSPKKYLNLKNIPQKQVVDEIVRKANPTKLPEPKSNDEEEARYVAYHIPERAGVLDKKLDKPLGEDIFTLLADIKNDLERIKKAVI